MTQARPLHQQLAHPIELQAQLLPLHLQQVLQAAPLQSQRAPQALPLHQQQVPQAQPQPHLSKAQAPPLHQQLAHPRASLPPLPLPLHPQQVPQAPPLHQQLAHPLELQAQLLPLHLQQVLQAAPLHSHQVPQALPLHPQQVPQAQPQPHLPKAQHKGHPPPYPQLLHPQQHLLRRSLWLVLMCRHLPPRNTHVLNRCVCSFVKHVICDMHPATRKLCVLAYDGLMLTDSKSSGCPQSIA